MTRTTRKSQGGFTLLEMLVTVGIMAAVAGTATVALQDTTARASAAAHVAMMDELNEGARVFRTLRGNSYPNNLDSLITTSTAPATGTAITGAIEGTVAADTITNVALTADMVGVLADIGMSHLQYIDTNLDGDGADSTETCADIPALINSRANAVVAGNIFMSPGGNGCGVSRELEAGDEIAVWTGGKERLTGQPEATGIVVYDGTNAALATSEVYMAVGFGPASNLFDASQLGGLTSVPVYRHVGADEYNRFIGLFYVGDFDAANGIVAADQVSIVTVVDGAGDTKEEELGEWDGTRNTI